MKRIAVLLLSIFLTLVQLSGQTPQKVNGKLKFDQGQSFEITLQLKSTIAQQAMGQAIDFTVDATGDHGYKITNSNEDNSTLHHVVKRIRFSFDGMGQKMSFDSNEEKDLNGRFGKPIKDVLDKNYDIIIDPNGTVLMARPEKVDIAAADSRMAIITTMLKEVLDLVQPPQKGKNSFFKVLPDKEMVKGDTWTESWMDGGGKYDAAYILTDIKDSTIIVDYVTNSVTITKAEMMGSETTTTMNNKSTGKIILDRITGIPMEKTINTESNGTTEASFGSLPVTSKTNTIIKVTPVKGQ